mgnify:CR=1 FL=1
MADYDTAGTAWRLTPTPYLANRPKTHSGAETVHSEYVPMDDGCRLTAHDERSHERISAAVSCVDEIVSCYRVSGSGDYVLRVMARDMAGYGELLSRVIGTLPSVSRVESSFVLKEVKAAAGLPVELLRASSTRKAD